MQASAELPHSSPGAPALQFRGTYEPLKDGCDCIASFDGTQWRLEVLTLTVPKPQVGPAAVCKWLHHCCQLLDGMASRAARSEHAQPAAKRPRLSIAQPEGAEVAGEAEQHDEDAPEAAEQQQAPREAGTPEEASAVTCASHMQMLAVTV